MVQLQKFLEIYPGSITDTNITDLVGALENVLCHDGVLTDKGFAISEQLAGKGGVQNRPPMKSGHQFTTGECDANFKIACLRIHIERWIGYVRDFAILNSVWPCSRIDLLNSVWVFLANLLNLLSKVGPKE
ncbi:hypothetical protein QZH41_014256 [Actinostola sp. cb2023]|nr:hypothetical protein QZH41_014256 [Actinostola sp. cb2023]